jgi:hypothetical protein
LTQDCWIHIKTILSGTSSSIRTKRWWNSHWMVLFQNCVRQLRSPTKMAATVQFRCYWKQLWSRWAITGSLWVQPCLCLFKYTAWIHIIAYPEFSYVFQYANTGIIIAIQKWYSFINTNALPPRWPPQCNFVVIESSFDPGERLQAPGSLWY